MDTNEQLQANESEFSKMELDNDAMNNLNGAGKWAKFLAILGFIFIGLMVILGFSMGSVFSRFGAGYSMPFPTFLLGVIYLIFGVIYFFPILFLFRFSESASKALKSNNSPELNSAFRNLKAFYRYIGILTIVLLVLYAIGLLVFLLTSSWM